MPLISIEMDEHDFQRLTRTSMRWGRSWAVQAGRFEHTTKSFDTAPSWDWKMAYWVGEDWANVMLVRSFLKAMGADFEVVWDMAENPDMSYLILTDFETESWKNR
ncbi:hypothetical protein ACIOHC_36355 [Streptomyces sp. NPDC088252]|uniref:hypothetical protein n=1 Tax=Streptomyces sp. NPDC088252 TaxID=3365845 RepID=UPI00380009F6